MPIESAAALVAAAVRQGHGVAAFNVITLEHAEAIVAGAERAGTPVVLQISENAVRFHWRRLAPLAAAARAIAAAATVPVALHLDHVRSAELLHQAPAHGFGSVMVDASHRPYDENVAATTAAVAFGHRHGLWVEGELGAIGGKEGDPPADPHEPGTRTDPAQAVSYVEATGVDGLAVAVGSTHGQPHRHGRLDHDRVAALHAVVPVPLVLHGSSGLPDEELRKAVDGGLVKINIGTALNVAFTNALLNTLLTGGVRPVDPRRYLAPARDAVVDAVEHYLGVIAAPA